MSCDRADARGSVELAAAGPPRAAEAAELLSQQQHEGGRAAAALWDAELRPPTAGADPARDAASALAVTKVARGGAAWREGVRPGALLLVVGGRPAAEVGSEAIEVRVKGVKWDFVSADGRRISFRSASGCIGVALDVTEDAAAHALRKVTVRGPWMWNVCRADFVNYWALWEGGAWELLRRLTPSWRYASHACLFAVGSALLRKQARARPVDCFVAFNAAACYELGEQDAMRGFAAYWQIEDRETTDFQALVRYYLALDLSAPEPHDATHHLQFSIGADEEVDPPSAAEALFAAYVRNRESPRIGALASRTLPPEALVVPPARGDFPAYDLPVLWAAGGADGSLAGAAARSPCVLVILMGGYRTNGPYSHLMKQWVRWWTAYNDLGLRECHVITARRERRDGAWFQGENLARSSGAPTAVLYDEGGDAQEGMEAVLGEVEHSPFAVLLRGRRVLLTSVSCTMDDADVCDALTGAPADAPPEQQLEG